MPTTTGWWGDELGERLCPGKTAQCLHLRPALLQLDPGADGIAPNSSRLEPGCHQREPRAGNKASPKPAGPQQLFPAGNELLHVPFPTPQAAGVLHAGAGAAAGTQGIRSLSSRTCGVPSWILFLDLLFFVLLVLTFRWC